MKRILAISLALLLAVIVVILLISRHKRPTAVVAPVTMPVETARPAPPPPSKPVETITTAVAPESEAAVSGRVYGTVFQADGAFSSGASIEVVPAYTASAAALERTFHTTSLEDGSFAVEELTVGTYSVTAATECCGAWTSFAISHGSPVQEQTLILAPASGIRGIVMDPERKPLSGAAIYPVLQDGKPAPVVMWKGRSVVSAEDGTFDIAFLEPGAWTLYAFVEGFAPLTSASIPVGSEGVELQLRPGTPVRGQTLAEGRPIAGVTVIASNTAVPGPELKVISDQEGAFRFSNLAPGQYELFAEQGGLVAEEAPIPLSVGTASIDGLVIKLSPGGSVRGRVLVKETGQALPGIQFRARHGTVKTFRRDSAPSNAQGEFSITGLISGTYRVDPHLLPSYRATTETLGIVPGEAVPDLTFLLEAGIVITGRVSDADGEPVAGAEVRGRAHPGNWTGFHRSAPDGTYLLTNVPPGVEVILTASTSMAAAEPAGPLPVPETGLRDIELVLSEKKDGLIAGVVVDTRAKPLRLQVQAAALVESARAYTYRDQTDQEGTFVFPNMAPGDYVISGLFGSGNGAELHTLTLQPGQQVCNLRLVYEEELGGSITGQVADANGQGVQCTLEIARYEPQRMTKQGFERTTVDGHFEIANLAPGDYGIRATGPGGVQAEVTGIAPGTDNLKIVLAAPPQIRGKVLDVKGAPVGNFEVSAILSGAELGVPPVDQKTIADGSGEFTLTVGGGAYESYDVVTRAKGYRMSRVHVGRVEAVSPAEIIVELAPAGSLKGIVLDAKGAPAGGASLYYGLATADAGANGVPAAAYSLDDGTFEVAAPEAGQSVTLTAIHPDLGMGFVESPAPESSDRLQIVLSPLGRVFGIVSDSDGPIENAILTLAGTGGEQIALSDASGRFEIRSLPPGNYTLKATDRDSHATSAPHEVQIVSEAETEVNVLLSPAPAEPTVVGNE